MQKLKKTIEKNDKSYEKKINGINIVLGKVLKFKTLI
jgi:hypothetical protein